MTTVTVRCPMIECRRRHELADGVVSTAAGEPCLHFVAAWDPTAGHPMVEAIVSGLAGNREFLVRNLRPAGVEGRVEELRERLEAIAERAAHVRGAAVPAEGASTVPGALFADRHEANQVAREYATVLLGDDPVLGGGSLGPG